MTADCQKCTYNKACVNIGAFDIDECIQFKEIIMDTEITEDYVYESLSEFEDQDRFSLIRTILTQQREICRLAGKLNTRTAENRREDGNN